MKKILAFVFTTMVCVFNAGAATRDENVLVRNKNTSVTTQKARSISNRTAVNKSVSARKTGSVSVLKSRSAKQSVATRTPMAQTTKTQREQTINKQNVSARAATQTGNANTSEVRTGVEYEQCKTAFFTCMDQFCQLKNDNFRRCSCNDKVFKYQEITDVYQNANERLTEFTENLDVVGLTKEQAIAMKTATEGEDALTEDKSASKQLLQAIMNAIKGEDSTVGGKYQSLNSLTISPDMSNAFGMNDYGQIVAAYNGNNLYKAVYPQCRNAVKGDCNNASLQRAVNAYLMAIEQDCNTVEAALATQQKTLKASTYESSAMLDLARVENRQKHNSVDVSTCLANVESAIQSEEVCGANYHKCLDDGRFIDVTTGAPLTGVKNFYELGTLLTFKSNENIQNQKLSSIANNKQFVKSFENKTKKFAKDALDECTEQADFVWQQYLDRALLDIYYAQQSKVETIQNSCFDLIAACYDDQKTAITTAMVNLTGTYSDNLQAATTSLTQQMCDDYIESCNNMFAGNVIQNYMNQKTLSDSEKNCRKIAQNCFDNFGGTGYENFYSLQNGLFKPGNAIDWFTLYDKTDGDGDKILSPCAQELYETAGCNTPKMLERVFGGLDKYNDGYRYQPNSEDVIDRQLRSQGIASEVYTKVIDNLSIQCENIHGFFVEARYAEFYGYKKENFCQISYTGAFYDNLGSPTSLNKWYNFKESENMCPQGYANKVDVQSWGMCSCWENGNYRSKNGTAATCLPVLPIKDSSEAADGSICSDSMLPKKGTGIDQENSGTLSKYTTNRWCQQYVLSERGQLCPTLNTVITDPVTSEMIERSECATNPTAPESPSAIPVLVKQKLHNE